MNLPLEIAEACKPLFDILPLHKAMPQLVGTDPAHHEIVEGILQQPALHNKPALEAALWLYVNDLDRSHRVSQTMEGATGAYWHGIMHRREGDFHNSHHWMRQTTGHPFRALRSDLDPDVFVDAVAAARGGNPENLVAKQRDEWQALFEWCAENPE